MLEKRVLIRKAEPIVMEETLKTVSVIIPFSKPETVGNAIESVLNQDYPEELLEIIVVGKGSEDLLEKWAQIIAVDEGPIRQPGRARNLGAAMASGEILLFLDDDCEAQENWIRENLVELEKDGVGAVSGKIVGKSNAFFARCVDFTNFGICQTNRRREGRLWTATFGIKKSLFHEVNGFDEEIKVQEDIDLCFRLNQRGYMTVYQPRILVVHDHGRNTLRKLLDYQYSSGKEGGIRVESKYKDLSIRNRILAGLTHPLAYALFIIPFAIAGTLSAIKANLGEHKDILLLSPFIFLGKISCHAGIWRWHWARWTRGFAIYQGARNIYEYSLLKYGFRTPRIVTLFVTSSCNARCSHCFYWKKLNQHDDLSFGEIKKLSQSIGKVDKLLISGGEPFLRRDLPRIYQLFIENNDLEAVSIPTNGLMPERIYELVNEILELSHGRPVTISLSIDGTEKFHDQMRGVAGTFMKLVETYERLHSLQDKFNNLIIRIATTVMESNYEEVIGLFDQASNQFPGVNSPCINLLRGDPQNVDLRPPSMEKAYEIYKYKTTRFPGQQGFLRKLADKLTFVIAIENLRQNTQVIPCEAGRILGVIEHNGDVKHCELLPPIGNIREDSFDQIWNSSIAHEARKRIVAKQCNCTHECYTFPSLIANPTYIVRFIRHLLR
jgi:MoaA/NifB/PqqE/SkfB family radical SAM enzyme